MTDLMDLLDSAAGRPAAPTSETVDGDLRRGRRALLHRRWARGGALVVTGAAVAVGMAVLPGAAPSSGQHRVVPAAGGVTVTGPTSSPPANGQSGATSVPTPGPGTLVPADPSGKDHAFSAALVPHAWQQQLSDYVLAFEPPGTDTVINDFGGKLVVVLAGGVTPPSDARHLRIGGNEARAWTEGDTSTYYVALADGGTNLVLQVPAALGWDDTTVARFAEGLAVGPGARAGVG
jgi:hypothetical protein